VRILFFGTPDFAVPALRALLYEGFDVVAAITQPDRPRGRSRSVVHPPAVKEAAVGEGIPVLQPEHPNEPDFLEQVRPLAPDLGVVVAYGHILRPALLELPSRGMVNVHASLLPALRGAAPIPHTIIQGLEETGVTIMQMDAGMDTGPILLQVPTPVASDETAGELEVRLAELGALALIEALAMMDLDALRPRTQEHELATHAPKITQDMARIRWEEPAARIARLVRGLDPRPGAWTSLGDRRIKLFGPRSGGGVPDGAAPGDVVEVDPALIVATGDGSLQFLDVQPEGRGRFAAADWIRGRGAHVGDRFM
jgi:methionyl-tRNA formyltransferase